MPAGIRGQSVKVRYTTDTGVNIALSVPKYIADIPGTGLGTPDGTEGAKPARFKPRVVFWEAIVANVDPTKPGQLIRRQIPFNAGALIIAANATVPVTVDGINGDTTGRRGEKLTYSS